MVGKKPKKQRIQFANKNNITQSDILGKIQYKKKKSKNILFCSSLNKKIKSGAMIGFF